MINKMTEQFKSSLNPFNDLIANNAKVLVQLAEQQTKLFSDIVTESVAYTKTLSTQKDMPGVVEVQKAFIDKVQGKIVSASEEATKLFSEVQTTSGETVSPMSAQNKPAQDAK